MRSDDLSVPVLAVSLWPLPRLTQVGLPHHADGIGFCLKRYYSLFKEINKLLSHNDAHIIIWSHKHTRTHTHRAHSRMSDICPVITYTNTFILTCRHTDTVLRLCSNYLRASFYTLVSSPPCWHKICA